ncbi:MAG: alpha/beta hydrolase [Deltaproteobacteria bacterium]|nr:alpha/beta hydrolase [Deltaproteobacteria bacterium]
MGEVVKQKRMKLHTTGQRVVWMSVGAFLGTLFNPLASWLKNTFLFHPNVKVEGSPAAYGLPYEEVWFGGPDGRTLHGWYIPAKSGEGGQEPLFLWFHGNAGNIGHRLAHVRVLYEQVGGSHFLFDYQGFGHSHGKPSIPGILADGRDAIAVVHQRGWATGKSVVYFGESLGSAVVITVAVEAIPPSRVILLAPFHSLRAMGDLRLPLLSFLVAEDLNSARLVGKLQVPLLVIHGTDDRTIPFQQGQDLFVLAPEPKRFYCVEGGAHTKLYETGGSTYTREIREFVRGRID